MYADGRRCERDTVRPRQVPWLPSALQYEVVSQTDLNPGSAVEGRDGADNRSRREKPSTVALATMATIALVLFCALEVVLFQAPTSNQSLLWTMLLRAVPSAAGGLTLIGPGILARGRGWRGYLYACLLALVFFDASELVIASLYGLGQAVT
jgi:uncharacterized membrane protein